MKGTIFVELLNLVEQRHGLDMVDAIIERASSALATGGAYTSVGNYPHTELLELVAALSTLTNQSAESVLDEYAAHLMNVFHEMHPEFFERAHDYLDFLQSVESHVHKEVLKLYPEAAPPTLTTQRVSDHELVIHYQSHRPLAAFAECLARQGARLFDTSVAVETASRREDGCAAVIRVKVEP